MEFTGVILPPLLMAATDVIPAILTVVGALVGAVVMAKTKTVRRLKVNQQSNQTPHFPGATTTKKEKEMTFIPIIPQGSGYRPATTTASSHVHPISVFWFIVLMVLAVVFLLVGLIGFGMGNSLVGIFGMVSSVVAFLLSFLFLSCLKVVDQWDRVVVLKFGKFKQVQQPGLFWLTPFVDTVAKWIDTRVQTTDLLAEETLTRDTVPVDVDAVMFWLVYDPKKAALEVENFQSAVTWAAQTALRDLIGKTELAELLVGRDVLDSRLQEIIDERTEPWGVTVQSVEIREIKIPRDLQDTMSRQAQAERERQARVILGESEMQIAKSFSEAAKQYHNDPTALHLRAMNMLFEGLKEKGSLMIVPSSAIDSMNLGAVSGMASLGMQHDPAKQAPVKHQES